MTKLTKLVMQEIKECAKVRDDLDKREALAIFNKSYNSCVLMRQEERGGYALRRLRDYLWYND